MTSFFGNVGNALGGIGVNPFSTQIGSKIEQATDASLASENWSLNMEICDLINGTEDGPKDALKAIRKRLAQNVGKNYTVIMYTLIVLETCVKNCGKRFQILVCTKDFIQQELVKLIGPKNDPPTAVQEKVLSLIQAWADAFQNQPEMSGVASVYKDLLSKGIEFPATDLDALAPIHTPKRTVTEPETQPRKVLSPNSPTGLSPEQRAKLQSELDVVQSNMNVFGEMLTELKPGDENPPSDELELLLELNTACHSMQSRLMELITRLSNDELTAELLRINDEMNNLFLRFSRWEKNRTPSAILTKAIPPPEQSLINFDDVDVAKLSIEPKDEFDMFAASRNVSYESSKKTGSTYEDNKGAGQVSGIRAAVDSRVKSEEMEFNEMANWLGATGTEESVTSSEFEKFLEERASAVETTTTATPPKNKENQKVKTGGAV